MTLVHTLVCIQGCAQKPGLAQAITLRERAEALGIILTDGKVFLYPLAAWRLRRLKAQMSANGIQLFESRHGEFCDPFNSAGAALPAPVEILFGPALYKRAGVALLEILARVPQALIEMPDAAFTGLIYLPPYFCGFPPVWGEMQLGPRLGPSCDPLFKLRFGR